MPPLPHWSLCRHAGGEDLLVAERFPAAEELARARLHPSVGARSAVYPGRLLFRPAPRDQRVSGSRNSLAARSWLGGLLDQRLPEYTRHLWVEVDRRSEDFVPKVVAARAAAHAAFERFLDQLLAAGLLTPMEAVSSRPTFHLEVHDCCESDHGPLPDVPPWRGR
jgi:hypothetical protein